MIEDSSLQDTPCWKWSSSERGYIWWDGGEFTGSLCCWSGTGWVPTDGLNDPPLAGPPPVVEMAGRLGTFLTVLTFPGRLWLGAGTGCGL